MSLPNEPLALLIRAEISSSINAFCNIVLPKYVNLSVTFSELLSIVMVGAVQSAPVFFRLIVSPKRRADLAKAFVIA